MELMELTSRPNQKTSFTSRNELEKFLICNCKQKSLGPLHVIKACEKKCQVLWLPQEPQNALRK